MGNYVRKERAKWSKFAPSKKMKRKEVKGESNLVANERFKCLVAFGRFQVWWPLEAEGELSFSPLFIFPSTNFAWPFFFPLILRFYFTMVLDHYFTPFLPFLWLINCNHGSLCTKFSTHSLPSWFWLKIFLSLNSWHHAWPCRMSLKPHKWMKNHLRSCP